MGEVSYKLMAILIAKRIKKDVDTCVLRYKSLAESLDREAPDYTEKLLSLSVGLSTECKTIALRILNKYEDHYINCNKTLRDYKEELINGPKT